MRSRRRCEDRWRCLPCIQGHTDMALGHTTLGLMLTGASGYGAEGHVLLLTPLPSKDAAH